MCCVGSGSPPVCVSYPWTACITGCPMQLGCEDEKEDCRCGTSSEPLALLKIAPQPWAAHTPRWAFCAGASAAAFVLKVTSSALLAEASASAHTQLCLLDASHQRPPNTQRVHNGICHSPHPLLLLGPSSLLFDVDVFPSPHNLSSKGSLVMAAAFVFWPHHLLSKP